MKLLTERLKKREEERDKEDPDERGREHAREGCDADGPTARGARPCREHQRQDAEEEAPGRHHHRAEADGGALLGGFNDREPGLTSCFREFDHQNGVLSGQTDEHHHAELRVNRHVAAGEFEPQERSHDGKEHGKHDRERNRPAFILCDKEQVRKEKRQTHQSDDLTGVLPFLLGEARPLDVIVLGERRGGRILNGLIKGP